MYLTNVRNVVSMNILSDVHLMYITMHISNVQYVAYNALYTMHIEMQIKTAFVLKHIGSTLLKHIKMYIDNVHTKCI